MQQKPEQRCKHSVSHTRYSEYENKEIIGEKDG